MALASTRNLNDVYIWTFFPTAGTPGGARVSAPAPIRGRVVETGFMPASLVASAITMAVSLGTQLDSANSAFTQIITSTLGTFSSTNLFEGAVASVIPPSPSFVNVGDAIQWTCSGGNTSLIGATMYAVLRRA